MLPQRFRLTIRQFNQNAYQATVAASKNLTLVVKASQKSCPRFVILVPKTVDKRASFRNKVRRVIIEAIRKKLGDLNSSVDVLISARKIIKKEDSHFLETEIFKLLKQTGLFKLT